MGLHPIRALDHVVEEYRDYLLTEFRAKDDRLRQALELEIDRPLFLAQEPFYQAHRPFKTGACWQDLPIDPGLAKAMVQRTHEEHAYLHQSEAIVHLLGPSALPMVITTGTGSGKTECFLLPVIQNAIEDATRFRQDGLTAILVYPMNALANDQIERIRGMLGDSGFSGAVRVDKYDRGTSQAKREELRRKPPHILLTNYVMLEYLLTRPADREAIFANHRCRFLVLDEVHTYRGTLGTHIALLARRLRAHLSRARQDWGVEVSAAEHARRFPELIPVGTSATIKSLEEEEHGPEETLRLRDEAVREFFSNLSGASRDSIRVISEELAEVQVPSRARYSDRPAEVGDVDGSDPEAVRRTLCALAGLGPDRPVEEAASLARILWDLGTWLVRKPMSVSQIVERVQREIPERQGMEEAPVRREVEAALVAGAALAEGTPGALRLRAHRFLRGGWHFHRCVDPNCGRIYPRGEERCECGQRTAPLYLCRNCGADYLRFFSDGPSPEQLTPASDLSKGFEWLLYDPTRFEEQWGNDDDSDEQGEPVDNDSAISGRNDRNGNGRTAVQIRRPTQIQQRPVFEGSFDPGTMMFSTDPYLCRQQVVLTPARTKCMCCGGSAGSRSVLTPVSLGTSAAVKVAGEGMVAALASANLDRPGHDGKERLLIFSDSRQDAAHQARFILFASRYDRMRRRVAQLLEKDGPSLPFARVVQLLGAKAVEVRDNPHVTSGDWVPEEVRKRIEAWEEAPLLDDLALSAGYRWTLL
ncbi:MAG: DEAD/DEAH box helicase, partial [Chloroflexota bacterium]